MGTLDPRKLIELKINHMNIFRMKISQITVGDYDDILTVKSKLVGTSDQSGHLENIKGCKVTDLYEFIFQTEEVDRCLYVLPLS